MNIEFDPVRCAELHNELLAKTISHIPGATGGLRQDVFDRWHNISPELNPNNLRIPRGSPLHTFLSLIHSFSPDSVPLTAEFIQPIPEWFASEGNEITKQAYSLEVILLYGDETMRPNMDGGLYFDLKTTRVCSSRSIDLSPNGEWVPLQVFLGKSLKMWERGKFYWGQTPSNGTASGPNCVCYKAWVLADLERAIGNWEFLLSAIQDRIPLPAGAARPELLEPLPAALVDEFEISSFAKAFLSVATRPTFECVAPGITVFTPESFAAIYGAESDDSVRKAHARDSECEPSSLILPSTTGPIQHTTKATVIFDGEAHLMIATPNYCEYTGVYTQIVDNGCDGDGLTLFTAEGAQDPVRADARPWGPSHSEIRLDQMLDLWIECVDKGYWKVGREGVSTPNSWFTNPRTLDYRKMGWLDSDVY